MEGKPRSSDDLADAPRDPQLPPDEPPADAADAPPPDNVVSIFTRRALLWPAHDDDRSAP